MNHNDEAAWVRRAVECAVADSPCDYDFPTSLVLLRNDGSYDGFVFRPGPSDTVEQWAAQTVRENLAVNAVLVHCNWMPGRAAQCDNSDYLRFAHFIDEGADPRDWPGSVEVIGAGVLAPAERPWAVFGCLQRNTAPVSVEWDAEIVYPMVPVLEAIAIELLNVQAVLRVFPQVFKAMTAE